MKEKNIRCLITAGPTREYFDPVRFMSNPSSGKMGYAIAQAAIDHGWTVDLVSGPVALNAPTNAKQHPVTTGEDMFSAVDSLFDHCNVLIMTAAVMDYRPANFSNNKIKKTGAGLSVELLPVVDILKTVAARKQNQFVVGFAAETNNIVQYARSKLLEKNCDCVIANKVGIEGSGFESDRNQITIVSRDAEPIECKADTKQNIARELISYVASKIAPDTAPS